MDSKINEFLLEFYNLKCEILKPITGYEVSNFFVKTDEGEKYILKHYCEGEELIAAENEVLTYLNGKIECEFSYPIYSKNNKALEKGGDGFFRLLSFVDGMFLSEVGKNEEILSSLGRVLADIDVELSKINNCIIKGRRIKWDNQYALDSEKYISYINDFPRRKLIEYFFLKFKENVIPELSNLRKSIIHNDGNDWNVLVKNGVVSGIIDFGDMCYTHLINELAVALPYIMFGAENPIDNAVYVIKAYHQKMPLEEKEIRILYYLIAIRLCISVCNSAYHSTINPENKEYITISEKSAWELLKNWIFINPVFVENEFRKACGFEVRYDDLDEQLRKRKQLVSNALSLSYERPIHMAGAAFQYMYDANGKTILDAYNNIPIVGHCHPKVVSAGQKQMARLNTNTRYVYDELNNYIEKLLSKFPISLSKVFLVNSGSAASDLAIRMALARKREGAIVVLEHGYHGNTKLGIDISSYKFDGDGGEGTKDGIIKLPMPDIYRNIFIEGKKKYGELYAEEAIRIIEKSEKEIACFIVEPIMGCGGQIVLPEGYLKKMFSYIKGRGGICIADEVQIGFGRVGTHFWGFEQHGVEPDIVVLGKPIGNGHPMGAVVCTEEVNGYFENGMEFFSSFGGNPVSCAIGLSVLDVLEEENLQENSLRVGNCIMNELKSLQNKYPIIGDVRGSGLFWGMELVMNPDSKEPATELAKELKNYLKEENILIGTDGPFDNVIKSKPPLCFNMNNADQLISTIETWLKKKG